MEKEGSSVEIQVESLSAVKHRIRILVAAERVRKDRNTLYKSLKKQARIRGFRPGKAPRAILERHYGEDIDEQLREDLMRESLEKAVEDNELKMVSRPEIESSGFEEDGGFSAVATVETLPEFRPKDYHGLALQRMKVVVRDEDLDERLKWIASLKAVLKPVLEDRPAGALDYVEVSYDGTVDGVKIDEQENVVLFLGGEDAYLPGARDEIPGLRVGEEKTYTTHLPEDSRDTRLAGKDVLYRVRLKAIKEKVPPELDDEFVKDLDLGLETLDELRRRERDYLEMMEKERARRHDREGLIDALLEKNDFEVPDALVRHHSAYLADSVIRKNFPPDASGQRMSSLQEEAREQLRPDALRHVRASLLFSAIAQTEGIRCEEDDLRAWIEDEAKRQGRIVEEISAELQEEKLQDSLKDTLREEKTVTFLLENAQVEWVDPPSRDEKDKA